MKDNLYVLSTPYHILLAICDIVTKNENSILILISNNEDDIEFYKDIKKRLLKVNLISTVYIAKKKSKFGRVKGYSEIVCAIEDEYDVKSLNLFSWNLNRLYMNSNYFFNYYKGTIPINLFEDGGNVYLSYSNNLKKKLMNGLYRFIGVGTFPNILKNVDSVKVSYPEKYPSFFQGHVYKINVMEQIKEKNINEILSAIFLDEKTKEDINTSLNLGQLNILFTQPLSRDGFISSEEQYQLYNRLINKYSSSTMLLIKYHPRDDMQYEVNENCISLGRYYPSELLMTFNFLFDNSIGVNSSAVKSVRAREYVNEGLK